MVRQATSDRFKDLILAASFIPVLVLSALIPSAVPARDPAVPQARALALEPILADLTGANWVRSRIWLLSDTGAVAVVDLPRGGDEISIGSAGKGSSAPTLSPDGWLIAYSASESLFVYDTSTRLESLVHVGSARHSMLITGWSPDGKYLLFYPSPPRYPERYEVSGPVDPATGFRVYELATGTVLETGLNPGARVQDWLNENTLLVKIAGSDKLVTQHLFTGETRGTAIPGDYFQIEVVPGSRDVFAMTPSRTIVRVSIDSGKEQIITGPDSVGTMTQYPRPSPEGNHVAWSSADSTGERLFINGVAVTEAMKVLRLQWLNESSIVVSRPGRPLVIDAGSGKVLYQAGE